MCKPLSAGNKARIYAGVNVPAKEAPANFVPAAAVIRGGQVLFGITGRKGSVGGLLSWMFKTGAQPRRGIQNWES